MPSQPVAYCSAASTSIGAVVTAPRNANQPPANPASDPNAYWGNRAEPPATGNMPPNSACTSASRIMAAPPRIHEMIAAGPATSDAPSAPNSQPEPMIDPTEVNNSPTKPMSRRSRGSTAAALPAPSAAKPASLPRLLTQYPASRASAR